MYVCIFQISELLELLLDPDKISVKIFLNLQTSCTETAFKICINAGFSSFIPLLQRNLAGAMENGIIQLNLLQPLNL